MTEKEFEDLYYQSCEEVPEHSSRGVFKEKVFSLKLFAQNFEAYVKSQRPWIGLTDEEIVACWARPDMFAIAHAIEAKLKEKNGHV